MQVHVRVIGQSGSCLQKYMVQCNTDSNCANLLYTFTWFEVSETKTSKFLGGGGHVLLIPCTCTCNAV